MEKSTLLEIDSYHVESFHIAQNPAFDHRDEYGRKPPVAVDFNLFTHKDQHDKFAVTLRIKSVDPVSEEYPFKFSMRLMGVFVVAEPFADPTNVPAERAVNGLTILYGLARGYLDTASGWFGPQLNLPTIYFTDLVRAKIAESRQHELEEPMEPQAAAQ